MNATTLLAFLALTCAAEGLAADANATPRSKLAMILGIDAFTFSGVGFAGFMSEGEKRFRKALNNENPL